MVCWVDTCLRRKYKPAHVPTISQLFDLTGRVAIVTGGSRGLGQEMAEGLGEAGARLMVCARRSEWLTPAGHGLPGPGVGVQRPVFGGSQPGPEPGLRARTAGAVR